MEVQYQEMIFQFLGGLGIFLFGIRYMVNGLRSAAGERLRDSIDRLTTNPYLGLVVGIIITILIQSSTGIMALTVGLVSGGFMTLRQSIPVIIGANIGTAISVLIIGIKLGDYSLPIIALGAIFMFLFKKQAINSLGKVIFGFGALFYGLELMSNGMHPLRTIEVFQELTMNMSANSILGVTFGILLTITIQSSGAAIEILQSLLSTHSISLDSSLPILFGANIGTTATAIIASIGASIAAKRTALVHVLFNIIGTILLLILLEPFTMFINFCKDFMGLDSEITVAFAHCIFNIFNAIVLFPFVSAMIWLVTKLIPGENEYIMIKPQFIEKGYSNHSPTHALEQTVEELKRMKEFTLQGFEVVYMYLQSGEKRYKEKALWYEAGINLLDREITKYLVEISSHPFNPREQSEFALIVNVMRDIERIGDHMENMVELAEYKINNDVEFSMEAKMEFDEMYRLVMETLPYAYDGYFAKNTEYANKAIQNENELGKLEKLFIKRHIQRLNERKCSGEAGILFLDLINNLVKVGDHASRIAEKNQDLD